MCVGLVLSGPLLCPGCGTPRMQSGSDVRAKYAWDTLRARLDYPIDDTYRAASDAVRQLDLDVLWHDHDGVAGQISTLDAQREHISVEMEALVGGQTALWIRAGIFGDRNKAEVVFERIMENLREEPPVAKQ